MSRLGPLAVALVLLLFATGNPSAATTITIDNFENGNLNAWKPGSSGQIVVDPLNASNHALHFTALADGGDIWTATTYAATGTDWWVSFDYLGRPGLNTGGFLGWDTDTLPAGTEHWFAGTTVSGGPVEALLVDDGAWHHYVVHLIRGVNLTNGPVYIKAEDWIRADAIVGNAYFDNIVISDVDPALPVPVLPPVISAALFVILCAVAVIHLRRRQAPKAI